MEEIEAIILERFRETQRRVEELRFMGVIDVGALEEFHTFRKELSREVES